MEGSEEFVTYRFTGRFQSDGDDLRHGLYEFVRASDWTAEETWDYEVAAIVDHFEQYGASESVSRLGGCLRVAYPSAAAALTRVLFDASLRNAQRHDRCVGELLLPALKQCDYIGDANSVGVLIGVEPRLTALVSRMDSNAREDALFLAISQSSEALLQAIRLGIRSASVESGLHIALESAEASDLVEWAERVPAWADKSCETVLFFRLGRARLLGSPGTTEIEAALEVLRRRRQELR